jgi:hypothetical protein
VIRHEDRVGKTAEDLDDVNIGVVGEAGIRGQQPESREESRRAGNFMR